MKIVESDCSIIFTLDTMSICENSFTLKYNSHEK